MNKVFLGFSVALTVMLLGVLGLFGGYYFLQFLFQVSLLLVMSCVLFTGVFAVFSTWMYRQFVTYHLGTDVKQQVFTDIKSFYENFKEKFTNPFFINKCIRVACVIILIICLCFGLVYGARYLRDVSIKVKTYNSIVHQNEILQKDNELLRQDNTALHNLVKKN